METKTKEPNAAMETKVVDQDYPIDHVPQSARRSFFSIAAVLLGITFFAPTMSTGAQIAAAFTFSELMWIVLIGNLVLGVYVALNCGIGAKTGLTSVMLSRYTLGVGGCKWAGLLLGGTQIGWYAYVSAYTGQLFSVAFHLPDAAIWFTLLWAIIFGVTAIWGYKAMEKVAYVAVPALLLLVIYIPIMFLMDILFQTTGLAISQTVAEIISMFLAFYVFSRIRAKKKAELAAAPKGA